MDTIMKIDKIVKQHCSWKKPVGTASYHSNFLLLFFAGNKTAKLKLHATHEKEGSVSIIMLAGGFKQVYVYLFHVK